MDKNLLLEQSKVARENAYAPYSKFKVGAALLGKNGKIYYQLKGKNFQLIENINTEVKL